MLVKRFLCRRDFEAIVHIQPGVYLASMRAKSLEFIRAVQMWLKCLITSSVSCLITEDF